MIYLDTHVIVWLYEGLLDKLSPRVIQLIEDNDIFISPIVKLELCYLHETIRIKYPAEKITHELQSRIGLKVCETDLETIVNKAITLNWTRDPFDRLITANAICNHAKLLTKDRTIRKHIKLAVWD